MRARSAVLSFLVFAGVVVAACHRAAPAVAPAPASAAPEAVLLRVHGRVGQSRRVRIEMDNYMRFGSGDLPAGDSVRATMHMVQFATESVTAVSGDTVTVTTRTDSSRMEMPGMDMLPAGMLDSLTARGTTVTTRMDERGRMISVDMKGSQRVNEQMAAVRRMIPGLDSMTEAGSREGPSRLPDRPVRIGDTWADTSTLPAMLRTQGGAMVATYRFERIDTRGGHHFAVISSDVLTPAMTLEAPMRVSTGPMHTVGELQFDLDAGWIERFSMTITSHSHMEMGDVAMRMVTRQVPVEER